MSTDKKEPNTISRDELKKLPYITDLPVDGRLVMVYTYWDDQNDEWILFLEVRPGELGRLAGGEPIVGSYFARRPQDPAKDIELPFATFLSQHLTFPSVVPHISPLTDDIAQFAVILETFAIIEEHSKNPESMASLLAASTLEHLIIVVRATFDLLQKLLKAATSIVRRIDDPTRKLIQQLPESFAQVVLQGDAPRTADEITKKFSLPHQLGGLYANDAGFFRILRNLRVGIEHYGSKLPAIFPAADGFHVRTTDFPWRELAVWQESELTHNGLGPLSNVYRNLIRHTIETLNAFPTAYSSCISVPPAMNPDLKWYLRNPYGARLGDVLRKPSRL
jgi:hypothetical protein